MVDNLIYSIIIPSYNRSDEINELLTSLAKIEFEADHFEVIIADDGSTDGTNDLVQNFQKSVPFALHYLSQKNQGPGAARNLGMSKANGDFFIFLDSDVTVPHYWIKKTPEMIFRRFSECTN